MKHLVKVICPASRTLVDVIEIERAITNALDGVAKAALIDFKVTTQTWKNKPEFEITRTANSRIVSTDNVIYGYVNDGTRAHIIRPRRAKVLRIPQSSTPKTKPGVIGSGAGLRANAFFYSKAVRHPGTKARRFDRAIAKKWQREFANILQRAIAFELRGQA